MWELGDVWRGIDGFWEATGRGWVDNRGMSVNHEVVLSISPYPTLFLTEKALATFWKLNKRSQAASERVQRILKQAQKDVFIPFLANTESNEFEPRFSEFAVKYSRMRVDAISVLVQVFGPSEFKDRYFVILTKAFAQLSDTVQNPLQNAPDVRPLFNRYLKVSWMTANVARSLFLLEPNALGTLNDSIGRSDFGITALALIYDGTIQTPLWRITETFRCTGNALSEYEHTVAAVAGPRETWPKLGALSIEGDVDALFPDVGKERRKRKER